MGVPKLKSFPAKSVKKKECQDNKIAENAALKKEIENFKNIIKSKLKDPKIAKKAALIIQNMLKEEESKPSKKSKKG